VLVGDPPAGLISEPSPGSWARAVLTMSVSATSASVTPAEIHTLRVILIFIFASLFLTG
jgi:hypothetical protein